MGFLKFPSMVRLLPCHEYRTNYLGFRSLDIKCRVACEACGWIDPMWHKFSQEEKTRYKERANEFMNSEAGRAYKEKKRREYYNKRSKFL